MSAKPGTPGHHPDLDAALERDGITVAELARLVGVDARTINRWDESYRDLCDFVAGRSRAVRVEGGPISEPVYLGWVLERLGDDGVPRADVAKAINKVRALQDLLSDVVELLEYEEPRNAERNAGHLTPRLTIGDAPAMNPIMIQRAAAEAEGVKGTMNTTSLRLPEELRERLHVTAQGLGLSPSEYIRGLVYLFTLPQKPGS